MTEEIRIVRDSSELAAEAADIVVDAARRAVRARGAFHLVLSGGSTPRALHGQLVESPIDWKRTEIFFGDERAVPPDDPASNFRMARETLLDRVPVRKEAIHRIRGEIPKEEAAAEYEAVVLRILGEEPRFDLAVQGLGTDGHTASLFPGTPEIQGDPRLVVPSTSPVSPRDRVSLTLRALNAARQILFLVSGRGKADAVLEVQRERHGESPPVLPASLVRPADGSVCWLLDAAAASAMLSR